MTVSSQELAICRCRLIVALTALARPIRVSFPAFPVMVAEAQGPSTFAASDGILTGPTGRAGFLSVVYSSSAAQRAPL